MRLRSITSQFVFVLATAALLPLVCFGVWSLATVNRATRESVTAGNLRLAALEAEQIARVVGDATAVLESVAADLGEADLDQQERLLEDTAVRFPTFREIGLLDAAGRVVATSRTDAPSTLTRPSAGRTTNGVLMTPVRLNEHGSPSTLLSLPLDDRRGSVVAIVADLSLERVSQVVDRIRVGAYGGALLVQSNGVVIAASNSIRQSDGGRNSALTGAFVAAETSSAWSGEYADDNDVKRLGVTAPVKGLDWLLVLEQPTNEAFAASAGLGRQLALAALVALVLMTAVGFIMGRRFIAPILSLEQATHAVAEGHFDARVSTTGSDEFTRLARSFNTMADRLVSLQESIKSQERQVMFGRVVAGMFHDLSHPIETIANNAHLLLGSNLDEDERRLIGRTIDRERATLRRFLDDVLNVARPRPLERFPIDVNAVVAEVIDSMRAEAARSQVALTGHYASGAATISGDRFALGRVYRNLIVNAIQATSAGGRVLVNTSHGDGIVEIEVSDTGVGIPPDRLSAIFDDFVTTKKRGLGLGLATSRRIVEQLGGSIRVSSEVGRGSTFTVRFPSSAPHLAEATG